MDLDPKVWGPHYWFFFHTIALHYPNYPNEVTKKKYYEFVMNIPLFIPVENMSKDFSNLLDEYPITPYLESKKSFIQWFHFIHNKINEKLNKPKIDLETFYVKYYDEYKPKVIRVTKYQKIKEKIIYFLIILLLIGIVIYSKYIII
jgi:hypothetical protein